MVLLSGAALACIIKIAMGAESNLRRLAGSSDKLYLDQAHFDSYMLVMVLILVGFFLFHVLLVLYFHSIYKKMIAELHKEEAEGTEQKQIVGSKWASRALWAVQINLLFICFHFGFYITHTRFILKDEDSAPLFHIIIILLFFSNILLLPVSLPRVTMVDAFYSLDPDAVETVIARMQEAETDLLYLYKMWVKMGSPDLDSNKDGKITFEELQRLCSTARFT